MITHCSEYYVVVKLNWYEVTLNSFLVCCLDVCVHALTLCLSLLSCEMSAEPLEAWFLSFPSGIHWCFVLYILFSHFTCLPCASSIVLCLAWQCLLPNTKFKTYLWVCIWNHGKVSIHLSPFPHSVTLQVHDCNNATELLTSFPAVSRNLWLAPRHAGICSPFRIS